VGAHHRLVVRGAHHDPHFVRQGHGLGVVGAEGARLPHRRPQVVAAQAQDQLEHMLVEGRVRAAEPGARPAAQRRVLVVDEEAAVLDAGLVAPRAGREEDVGLALDRHVSPPMPGADADARRQLIGPEHRAAPVRAGDDEGARDARPGLVDDGLDVGLPLALQAFEAQLAARDQVVQHRALAQHGDDDDLAARIADAIQQRRRRPRHTLQVGREAPARVVQRWVGAGVDVDGHRLAGLHQGQAAAGVVVADGHRRITSQHGPAAGHGQHRGQPFQQQTHHRFVSRP